MSKTSARVTNSSFVLECKSYCCISLFHKILKNKALAMLMLCFFCLQVAHAQELRCNVQVMSSKIEGTNKKVYETLQKAIYEFMNNRAWTSHTYTARRTHRM